MSKILSWDLSGHNVKGHALYGYDDPRQVLLAVAAYLYTLGPDEEFLALQMDFNNEECTWGACVYYG